MGTQRSEAGFIRRRRREKISRCEVRSADGSSAGIKAGHADVVSRRSARQLPPQHQPPSHSRFGSALLAFAATECSRKGREKRTEWRNQSAAQPNAAPSLRSRRFNAAFLLVKRKFGSGVSGPVGASRAPGCAADIMLGGRQYKRIQTLFMRRIHPFIWWRRPVRTITAQPLRIHYI